MIDMVRRHEIQVLRRAGHSLVETAELVGVSQSTVQRVEAEAAVASFDTGAERGRRQIGRPSKAEPFRSFLVSELMAQPDVLAVELLDRARRQGYAGGKSALYQLVKELRPTSCFFLVSTEITGVPCSMHRFAVPLMCSNCALRSGCCAPSTALFGACRL
jgi:transposase